jgi:hypothetical protein
MTIDPLNLAIAVGLSLGHAALVVAVVNRLHALPLPHAVLHPVRLTHDAVIAGGPLLFFWLAGVRGPGLFFGGAWVHLPAWLLAYLAACGAAAVGALAVAIKRVCQTPVTNLISNHSTLRDLAQELPRRPVGSGPYRVMTLVPGNEFLKLEVSDKEYHVPGLPREWDGFSILHLSDLHFIGTVDLPYYQKVAEIAATLPADLVAFTGDLLDRRELISWLPGTLGRMQAALGCYYVLGNHDWYLENAETTRGCLHDLGWQCAAGRSITLEHRGRKLLICGSETPWMGALPNLPPRSAADFRIFLSHTPDNLAWARRFGIEVMLSGHNHGGQVCLPLFGPVYCPSHFGGRYAGGAFWEPPTLLYVSRGIGGRHPLRWRCPPELTRLILRATPVEAGTPGSVPTG